MKRKAHTRHDGCRERSLRCVTANLAVSAALALLLSVFAGTLKAQSDEKVPGNAEELEPASAYRIFTDAKGRRVEARLIALLDGQATLQLRNASKPLSWPASAFSTADQAYMANWAKHNISYRMMIQKHVRKSAIENYAPRPAYTKLTFPRKAGRGGISGRTPQIVRVSALDKGTEQHLAVKVTNQSSESLQDIDVAVWVIVDHHYDGKGGKQDSRKFIAQDSMVHIPEIKVGAAVTLSGNFVVENKTLRELVPGEIQTTGSGANSTFRVGKSRTKTTGIIQETFAGIMVRVYHDGKTVEELTDFTAKLKQSNFVSKLHKPGTTPGNQ